MYTHAPRGAMLPADRGVSRTAPAAPRSQQTPRDDVVDAFRPRPRTADETWLLGGGVAAFGVGVLGIVLAAGRRGQRGQRGH